MLNFSWQGCLEIGRVITIIRLFSKWLIILFLLLMPLLTACPAPFEVDDDTAASQSESQEAEEDDDDEEDEDD